jgi:prolipoprotein diacylglyceryltransferase
MDVFSLLLGLGAAAGLIWVATKSPEKKAHRNVDAGIAALFGALVGGRIAYVAVNWGYFQGHLVEIPEAWKGGISGLGALAGSVLALALLAVYIRPTAGELGDALLPLATTLTIAAWMGCWLDGSAYGAQVDTWWGLQARDEWGILFPRVPVQLIGALLALSLFWSVERISARLPIAGQAAGLALLGLSVELFGLSFLRADPTPYWRGMRLDAWGALALACLASIYLAHTLLRMWLASRKRKRKLVIAKAYQGR